MPPTNPININTHSTKQTLTFPALFLIPPIYH